MALTNFSLPSFAGVATQSWAATISPSQTHHASSVNNLLYGPAGHQEADEPPAGVSHQEYYKNSPFLPPSNFQFRKTSNYLPPHQQQPQPHQQVQHHQQQSLSGGSYNQPHTNYLPPTQTTRTYGEGSYGSNLPTRSPLQRNQQQYYNGYDAPTRVYNQQPLGVTEPTQSTQSVNNNNNININGPRNPGNIIPSNDNANDGFPERPPGFTRVQAGRGSRTQVHAVLDYDADEDDEADYYDDQTAPGGNHSDGQKTNPNVTPIQGPIFLKNGTAPVVPLFAYPTMNNGTFVQIPIWWTALSVALGLDIRGDVIKGVPCVKRYHQLFCPTAGNSYPIEKIERFIDDNKALMRRMYGDFEMIDSPTKQKRKRNTDEPEFGDGMEFIPDDLEPGESYFAKIRDRKKRQSNNFRSSSNNPRITKPLNRSGSGGPGNPGAATANDGSTGRVDACESKIEIVTPYWASNSAGKIRAIVNTQHFEQAIHQEICTKAQTSRCGNDCGCEQKYKWHRLLAYDPDNDCKGIFMDWFLFPSCCVCRCAP